MISNVAIYKFKFTYKILIISAYKRYYIMMCVYFYSMNDITFIICLHSFVVILVLHVATTYVTLKKKNRFSLKICWYRYIL